MLLLATAARILDVIFPSPVNNARVSPTDDLLRGVTSPTPARYDSILTSLSAIALFAYNDPNIRSAIKSLKYDGRKDVVEWFVHRLAHRLEHDIHEHFLIEQNPIVVIPLPLSRSRYIERGFNQSALIAYALCKRFPHELEYNDSCLVRSSFSQSQTKVRTRSERKKNIVGAFSLIKQEKLSGRSVLVVDDIITTGATMHEAVRILRTAHVARITTCALAH